MAEAGFYQGNQRRTGFAHWKIGRILLLVLGLKGVLGTPDGHRSGDRDLICSFCNGRANVPSERCDFCSASPSWHHGRCCPLKAFCNICIEPARVAFSTCDACGDTPSWHHNRCCPQRIKYPVYTSRSSTARNTRKNIVELQGGL